MKTHVDLCCGLGGWQEPFREASDWRTIGLDIRRDLNADIVGDVRQPPIDASPDVLTMSPPCTQFSRYSMPWLDEPEPDTELVNACYDAVDELNPEYWVLENVQGLKQYTGTEETKRIGPYYLWGLFPPFDVTLSDGGKMAVSGMHPEQRAKIPYELANALKQSVELYL
jgi:site-specific DNA-cytosine methylase